jgi:probable HAF family extracellular repeat protein
MTDLNTLLLPGSGWTLNYAEAINDAGQIVGIGTNGLNQHHAYLLTPVPEPTSFALLGIAAAGWLIRSRRMVAPKRRYSSSKC